VENRYLELGWSQGYSPRSADLGSTRAARRAGIQPATVTTATRAPAVAIHTGKPADVPSTIPARRGWAAAALPRPSTGGDSSDFDFLFGAWKVHNRRLRDRLKGSTTWDEFEATNVARPLLGGVGNEDVFRTEFAGGLPGMSFRFFDKAKRQWSIYWLDSLRGTLEPPVVGGFSGDVGTFEGADSCEGRPIRVRFIWSRVRTSTPRWEQAFSEDGGKTRETNWVMDFRRDDGLRDGATNPCRGSSPCPATIA
jgi:hypothetical protein